MDYLNLLAAAAQEDEDIPEHGKQQSTELNVDELLEQEITSHVAAAVNATIGTTTKLSSSAIQPDNSLALDLGLELEALTGSVTNLYNTTDSKLTTGHDTHLEIITTELHTTISSSNEPKLSNIDTTIVETTMPSSSLAHEMDNTTTSPSEETSISKLLSTLSNENQVELVSLFKDFQEEKISSDQFITKAQTILNADQLLMLMSGTQSDAEPKQQQQPRKKYSMNNKRKQEDDSKEGSKKKMKTTDKDQDSFTVDTIITPGSQSKSSVVEIEVPSVKATRQSSPQVKGAVDSQMDVTKMDVDSMMDVTSYGGVNLKQEEAEILGSLDSLQPDGIENVEYGTERIRTQTFFNNDPLIEIVSRVASTYGMDYIEPDYLSLISLACQETLSRLIEHMVITSKHRTLLLHEHYLQEDKKELVAEKFNADKDYEIDLKVQVKDDIRNVLNQLELAEKEEEDELRRARARALGEEVDDSVSFLDSPFHDFGASGTALSTSKGTALSESKNKSKGSRKGSDIPEKVKARLVNATALKAAGGPVKSWMLAEPAQSNGDGNLGFKVSTRNKPGAGSSFNSRRMTKSSFREPPTGVDSNSKVIDLCRKMTTKETRRVILKDALFCLENDKNLRKSDLLYKWNVNLK